MDLGPIRAHGPTVVDGDAREASVLVPIVEREDGPHVLFTKRADHLSDHPGQMSFPGGGREPEDEDRTATALREANEEIGLQSGEIEIHGVWTTSKRSPTTLSGRSSGRSSTGSTHPVTPKSPKSRSSRWPT
jgi:8-oxo-dGTP pyrophosphatase MutT (NUDIX family)